MMTLHAPALQEEAAHETVLKEAELSAQQRKLPVIRASFDEFYVKGVTNSGFLTTGRLELPVFQKSSPLLLVKIASLERESYAALRKKLQEERSLMLRLAYHETQGILANLPRLQEQRTIVLDLISREMDLAKDKLKSIEELSSFRRKQLVLDERIAQAEARLESLKMRVSYLTNSEDRKPEVPDVDESHFLNVSRADFERWKASAIVEHPDIIRQELEIEKQSHKVTLAGREWFPEVSAFSDFSHDPRFVDNEKQVFAGVRVSWDIWELWACRHETRKEEALLQEMRIKFSNEKRLLAMAMEEAFRAYQVSLSIWQSHVAALEFQRGVLESCRRRFEAGEVSWKEHALARMGFLDMEIALDEAREEVRRNEAKLLFALGLTYLR